MHANPAVYRCVGQSACVVCHGIIPANDHVTERLVSAQPRNLQHRTDHRHPHLISFVPRGACIAQIPPCSFRKLTSIETTMSTICTRHDFNNSRLSHKTIHCTRSHNMHSSHTNQFPIGLHKVVSSKLLWSRKT